MALNLITTKLMAPRLPQSVVERPQLLSQLQSGLESKLILVSAPAGSGKSTLLASWLKQLGRPTTWFSLDAGDNDLERFLLYLVSALQQIQPSIGAGLPEQLQTQTSVQPEPVIIGLINDFAQLSQGLVLVLDDYHVIVNEKVHKTVEFLLDHLPPGTCLVIATRTDPPVALARLRVRQQLLELRAHDLRFNLQETNAFLNDQLKLELSPNAIQSLEERTEGWVAGLLLAALSLEGRSDKEGFVEKFAGSHQYLVDYLMDEVLERQTPQVRQFLQRTSILERFTAALCEAVSEEAQARELLKRLLVANLFVVALDDERRWFRYHHLFAEFLRHRLREQEAALIPELHRRASAWFEREGWADEAIGHALAAQDFEQAGRLVEALAFKLGVYWNNAQLIKYVERLPLELLPAHPRLCVYYTWALVNTGQVGTLAAVLPVIEGSAAQAQQPRTIAVCVMTLRAYQHLWQLDFAGAVALCQEALAVLEPSEEDALSPEERWLRVAASNLVAYSYLHSDLTQANSFYPTTRARSQRLGNFVGAINGFARHGRVKHQLGQLHAALAVFEQGLQTNKEPRRKRTGYREDFTTRIVSAVRFDVASDIADLVSSRTPLSPSRCLAFPPSLQSIHRSTTPLPTTVSLPAVVS